MTFSRREFLQQTGSCAAHLALAAPFMMVSARDDESPLQESTDVSGGYPGTVGDDQDDRSEAAAVVATADRSDAGQGVDPDLFRRLVSSVRDYAIFALDPTGHIMLPAVPRIIVPRGRPYIGNPLQLWPCQTIVLPPSNSNVASCASGNSQSSSKWRRVPTESTVVG